VRRLTENKAIEDATIMSVMDPERAGRQPRDTRWVGALANIESPPGTLAQAAIREEAHDPAS
jgi:hypothetical protein